MRGVAPRRQGRREKGIALLDALLAVAVFALAMTGLASWMNWLAETSNGYGRSTVIQRELENLVREARYRPVADMNREFFDETLNVTFRTEVEVLELANLDGERLDDLYRLRAVASYAIGDYPMEEVAEVYLYRPDER